MLASELCANAVLHSNSRHAGGQFTVRAELHPGDYVWIEVEDQGGLWTDREPDPDRPHGLDIVREVAGDGNWGIDGNAPLPRTVWFRLDWPVTL
ncbi:MAG: ATP-binding protein [Streptosporangiaceae bacterium]|nr:ATP-binding protein [Streptosporangiaceae bacterium]MBV9856387.1 ATP-binding protein [Streptosporangiaceae bacterium]